MSINISKGLDLPLEGNISHFENKPETISTKRIALLGKDYHGLKPTMFVKEGEEVLQGDPLFEDKKNPGFKFLSPANGIISEINRGDRRSFLSLVIEKNNNENSFLINPPEKETREDACKYLIDSGTWHFFKTRPFSKVPKINTIPNEIFVSIIDSSPLSIDPLEIIDKEKDNFNTGLKFISYIPENNVHVSVLKGSNFECKQIEKVKYHQFSGPHPVGLVGTQIHFLSQVSLKNVIWSIGYQEVIRLGAILNSGYFSATKYIALAGPQVNTPCVLKTDAGSCTDELTAGMLKNEENRIISGSVFHGHHCIGSEAFLSMFSNQISVIREAKESDREFLNWLRPDLKKHSTLRMFFTTFFNKYKYNLSSSINGGDRAIVPIGIYEEIFPMDLMITQLLKAIVTEDTELAQNLGVLELDEEDLSICTYSCPSKYDYGSILRNILEKIEKDG